MANTLLSFASFNINDTQGDYSSLTGYDRGGAFLIGKQDPSSGLENWENIDSFCPNNYGFYQENVVAVADNAGHLPKFDPQPPVLTQSPTPLPQSCFGYGVLDDFDFNTTFLSAQPILEPEKLANIQPESGYSSLVVELLSTYTSGFKKSKGQKDGNRDDESDAGGRKLSTEGVMKLAGERYIQLSTSQRVDHSFMLMHPYGSCFLGLSAEEIRDVELAHLLLSAAEKVGYQQFDRASKLLACCEWLASDKGCPVERVVCYFAAALRERIDRDTGRFTSKRTMERERYCDKAGLAVSSDIVFLKFYQEVPFQQVMHFPGLQAILENTSSATKIHVIDLNIRSGVQWIALMQALADRVGYPVEHLKITAVGTKDGQKMEETGNRLASFAKSLNLPFSFKLVLLSDMRVLREEHFELEPSEAVAVFSETILGTMISRPSCLETLMRTIRRLNPSIMVVIEVEANHNSPSFFNRFIEALFYYSACFDCLEDYADRDDLYRILLECVYFGDGIHNIVAAEGEERTSRNVKINVWRAFFARFGMLGVDLSESALYQASLIVDKFACGRSCTLDSDGKCLLVGWKGTPIYSVSAWKFR